MSIKITGLQQVQDALKKEMQKISGGGFALVGIHEEAGNVEGENFSMATLGATQHYGNKQIPARRFLDNGVEAGNKEYIATIQEGIEKGLSVERILNQVGLIAVGFVQQYMVDLKSPPNAESTKQRKGSDNPLINTRALSQSITHSIANKKPEESL